jgi:hypothetical protein
MPMQHPITRRFVKAADIRNLTGRDGSITPVIIGEYRKVSIAGINGIKKGRTGKARLVVAHDNIAYVNRNDVVEEVSEVEALRIMTSGGINTLQATVTPLPGALSAEWEDFKNGRTGKAEWDRLVEADHAEALDMNGPGYVLGFQHLINA